MNRLPQYIVDELRGLREANEMLRSEVKELKNLISAKHNIIPFLTKKENEILLFLIATQSPKNEDDFCAYTGFDSVKFGLVNHVKRMKKTLEPHKIIISNYYGSGYYLDAESKSRAKAIYESYGRVFS